MFLKSLDKKTNQRKLQNGLPSIIGEDTKFHGNIISHGEIQIDGEVIGDVRAKMLTVHADAHIQGNITAEEIDLHGHITGNVRASIVRMFAQSRIEGDVTHEDIAIETGAFINGKCQHQTFAPLEIPEIKAEKQEKSLPESSPESSERINVYPYPKRGQDVA